MSLYILQTGVPCQVFIKRLLLLLLLLLFDTHKAAKIKQVCANRKFSGT